MSNVATTYVRFFAAVNGPSITQLTNVVEEKWDWLLPDHLLRRGFGCRHFDVAGARDACKEMISCEP